MGCDDGAPSAFERINCNIAALRPDIWDDVVAVGSLAITLLTIVVSVLIAVRSSKKARTDALELLHSQLEEDREVRRQEELRARFIDLIGRIQLQQVLTEDRWTEEFGPVRIAVTGAQIALPRDVRSVIGQSMEALLLDLVYIRGLMIAAETELEKEAGETTLVQWSAAWRVFGEMVLNHENPLLISTMLAAHRKPFAHLSEAE